MPKKYKITDKKTGRSMVIEGDAPPSSANARALLSQVNQPETIQPPGNDSKLTYFEKDHPMLDSAVGGMRNFLNQNPNLKSILTGVADYGEGAILDNVRAIIKGNIPESLDEAVMAPVLGPYKQAKEYLQRATSSGIGTATKEAIPGLSDIRTVFSTDPNVDVHQRLRASGRIGGQLAMIGMAGKENVPEESIPDLNFKSGVHPKNYLESPKASEYSDLYLKELHKYNPTPETTSEMQNRGLLEDTPNTFDQVHGNLFKSKLGITEPLPGAELPPDVKPPISEQAPILNKEPIIRPEDVEGKAIQEAPQEVNPNVLAKSKVKSVPRKESVQSKLPITPSSNEPLGITPPEDVSPVRDKVGDINFNLPEKPKNIQVLKFDPKTGVAEFVKEGEDVPQRVTLNKIDKLDVAEHQKLSGENDIKAAVQDILNAKSSARPLENLKDSDLQTLHQFSPSEETSNELAHRGSAATKSPAVIDNPPYEPSKIPNESNRVNKLLENSKKQRLENAQFLESEAYNRGIDLRSKVKNDLVNGVDDKITALNLRGVAAGDISNEDLRDYVTSVKNNELESPEEPNKFEEVYPKSDLANVPGAREPLPDVESPSKEDIPNVQTPEDFLAKGGKVTKIPPVEPNEPLEFGKPHEELALKVKKAREKSDSILNRLLKEESGTFNPKAITEWFNNLSKDDEFKKAVGNMQYKLSKGDNLTDEELDSLKDSPFGEAVLNYVNHSGKLEDLSSLFSSPDLKFEDNPQTRRISEVIKGTKDDFGEIPKNIYLAGIGRALDNIRGKFLKNSDSKAIAQKLDGLDVELSAKANRIYEGLKDLLSSEWESAINSGVLTKAGKTPGTISEYFHHMEAEPSLPEQLKNSLQAIRERNFGKLFGKKENVPLELGKDEGGNIYSHPKNVPESGIVEKRTGELTNISYDLDKVMRTYFEQLSRVKYDKPAVIAANEVISRLPEGMNKRLAIDYVRNYAGYDALDLDGALKRVERLATKTGSRSILPFSTSLQVLHLMRGITQVIPEALQHGPLPIAKGLLDFVKSPNAAVEEARASGMLPQRTFPIAMKTFGEKFDQIANFNDEGNSLAKGLALKIAKNIPGMDEKSAIDFALKSEGFQSPARDAVIFNKPGMKLVMQYKGWLQKYGELYVKAHLRALDKPTLDNIASAVSYNTNLAGLLYLSDKFGIKLAHLGFQSFQIGSPVGQMMMRATRDFSQGKTEDGIIEFLKFVTPMGQSLPARMLKGSSPNSELPSVDMPDMGNMPDIQIPN